tara:strand:+ start:220 stop:462 length:243 start_codon:yes stop_codon:yes gene_type:complete
MQNDYLHNKKKHSSENLEKESKKDNYLKFDKKNLDQKNKVDINKLLNRVKVDRKKKNKENLIIAGLVCLVVALIGIISII